MFGASDALSYLLLTLALTAAGAGVVAAQGSVVFDVLATPPGHTLCPLIQATDGNFYGTTFSGGAFDKGTIFKMTPGGTITVLHEFSGRSGVSGTIDGDFPQAALIQATDGNFYGTTYLGGASDYGTAFKMTPAGAVTVLYSFIGNDSGAGPAAALIQATDGNFYGTTQSGSVGFGTAFKMTPAGTVTVLHAFQHDDGPMSALIQATDGNFYGTNDQDGPIFLGTVFRITPAGAFTVLHEFTGNPDGRNPFAALIQASDGNFYGTTEAGGTSNGGTVFKMTAAGAVTILHSFPLGSVPGTSTDPRAALIQGTDGAFYGTTLGGGASNVGTVFTMTPAGAVTVLHAFAGVDGSYPQAPLILASDGKFYGTTGSGGTSGRGVVFRLGTVSNAPPTISSISSKATPVNRPIAVIFTVGDAESGPAGVSVSASSSNTTLVPNGNLVFSGSGAIRTLTITPAANQTGATTIIVTASDGTLAASTSFVLVVGSPVQSGDFDGDGKAEIAVFRPSSGAWYIRGATVATTFGGSGDIPVGRDYDGDGKTDIAVFRPATGVWFIWQSRTQTGITYTWGGAGDIPVPADYDGDGKADIAVFRPATGVWFIWQSATQTGITYTWGGGADIPVTRDYDGDGKTDIAVFRPATGVWFIWQSNTQTGITYTWGGGGDIPVPNDYDGDGKTDIAVFRPSTGFWFIWQSATQTGLQYIWGGGGDIPVPGDYDGDGKTDIAVFRPSTGAWFVWQSGTQTGLATTWGGGGDIPILKRP